jgi:imidazolonepropionase-like amidohydrolase
MATLNAAEWVDEKNKGFIKEGVNADFVLYKKNPLTDLDNLKTIKGIYFNHNWLNEREIGNNLKKLEQ